MHSSPLSSEAFATAALKLARQRDRTLVVKLGGSAMEDPASTKSCLESIAVLRAFSIRVVLVHGGGKPIDRAMADAGLVPKKVAGRRFTDTATLEIVVRVLHDQIRPELVKQLNDLGFKAVAPDSVLMGKKLQLTDDMGSPIDLGRVGSVDSVRDDLLVKYLDSGCIPVIPSLAADAHGWLNVNADTAASAVAGALAADHAIFLTDIPGVLRDRANPNSLIPLLSREECRGLIASGVIDGGMIPKVEACFEALNAGARSALILDGRVPYSLLDVFLKDRFSGTTITR